MLRISCDHRYTYYTGNAFSPVLLVICSEQDTNHVTCKIFSAHHMHSSRSEIFLIQFLRWSLGPWISFHMDITCFVLGVSLIPQANIQLQEEGVHFYMTDFYMSTYSRYYITELPYSVFSQKLQLKTMHAIWQQFCSFASNSHIVPAVGGHLRPFWYSQTPELNRPKTPVTCNPNKFFHVNFAPELEFSRNWNTAKNACTTHYWC